MKRFLLIAVLCLFSLPCRATTVVTDIVPGGFLGFHIFGEIPEPITLNAWLLVNFTFSKPQLTSGDGYFIQIGSNIAGEYIADYLFPGSACCAGKRGSMHFSIPSDGMFSFGNNISVQNGILDAKLVFDLPDGLSIAAPVPEPSTWILMLLGFAGLAAFTRFRPSRAGIAAQQVSPVTTP